MLHTNLTIRERTDAYVHARYQHPAWLLLASRRGPLVLSCLRGLFDDAKGDVGFDDALQSLAQALADHANHAEFDIGTADCTALARKELRGWIKRELLVERRGNLYATDALEEAMRFVEALGDRVMTSTASRLSVVQREIESVEASLNPDPKSRAHRILEQIADLEAQLSAVEAGHVDTLDRHEAVERIREIFNLAMSLRADFRRVEDCWREADRALRQSMVGGDSHRGEIMDKFAGWPRPSARHARRPRAALSAVAEPDPAAESPPIALTEPESMLYRHLRTLERGRLEQEFLPTQLVSNAVATWASGRSP